MSVSLPCRCVICGRGFKPDPRVGNRQKVCSLSKCQTARRQRTQASWRRRHPGDNIAWRARQREERSKEDPVDPPRVGAPLSRLPWEMAQEEFGVAGADFLASMGRLVLVYAKDQRSAQTPGTTGETVQEGAGDAKDQRWPQPPDRTDESRQEGAG